MDESEEHGPVKKVLVSAAIVAIIVSLMVALMFIGEAVTDWF